VPIAIICFLLITILGAGAALAQVLYGSITGTVTDTSGAVVPNVEVLITNESTGVVRTTTSDAAGEYRLGDVLPGPYTIAVNPSANFARFTQKGVQVDVNHAVRVDVKLQLGAVTTQVVVNSAAPILQTETAEVSHEITDTQLTQLPITSTQGRQYQALYTIIPGAAMVQEKNSTASNPSRAMSVNFNGISYNGNTTRIDGAINYYGWLPYLIAYVPPADSIANVSIVTNSFNAEQGVAGGAAVNVSTKSGTRDLHGSGWWYYQGSAFNAKAYTVPSTASVPKNIFNEFGFNVGGPVYIPHILTGRKKLFFFENFERTTRRQLISGKVSVPDSAMMGGNFSETASLPNGVLYDPQPGGVGPYLDPASRPTFQSEYGCNCIPASRLWPGSQQWAKLLKPITDTINTAQNPQFLTNGMVNDYFGTGTLAYNRNTSDTKINYLPSENTQIFGKYSIEPFSITDPQNLGAAGGGTFDGGQAGAASGRIQNVGLGMSHVISSSMVIDGDFGYTRQNTGAQSTVDIAAGDFGLTTLGIPGTNGAGINYVGQPAFVFGNVNSQGANNPASFSSWGNSSGANPFLFRDNQYTGDVNLSWTKARHAMKYGFTYYHFQLNHFQPSGGAGIQTPRGGFAFQGGMTCGAACGISNFNGLADLLLGLPNQSGSGLTNAVAKATQFVNPNTLRWSVYAGYAQDQWTVTSKLTLNYGVRYEYYPMAYKDHTGVYIAKPNLPQSANVEIGGVNGNPQNAGIDVGHGFFAPRLGIAYRINDKTVIRTGGGITSDPDSFRFLRDVYPATLIAAYNSPAVGSLGVNGSEQLPITVGIPPAVAPDISSGFVSLPVGGGTVTLPKNFHRGYIESWNLFFQHDFGANLVGNLGYIGTHQVRQPAQTAYLNASPLPTASSICMPNKQFNPSSQYYNGVLGKNPCSFQANVPINIGAPCPPTAKGTGLGTCYNTGGIGVVEPLFSANYNAMQAQLTRNAGRNSSFGLVYTWSHAFAFAENGAGTGSQGVAWNYPGYYSFNRASAIYDQRNNIQFWGIYQLPFGRGQKFAQNGVASWILGGWQLNGQLSHISGTPFTVNAASGSSANAQGNPTYANLVKPYHQLGGHGSGSGTGGKPWFDSASFANPTQPTYTATMTPDQIAPTVFGNTHRNEFRGPGQTVMNTSLFRGFTIYRESEFQIRFEAFNVLNHALLPSPNNTTVGGSTFGLITTGYGASRTLQLSGRVNF
jgi:hypothetical protein